MNQHPHTQQQPPPPPQPQGSPYEEPSDLSELDDQELSQALHTVHKLKRIMKARKLTQLKEKNRIANRLFGQMSSFFHIKLNEKIRVQKQREHAKKLARQNRQRLEIRKAKNQISQQLAGQMKGIEPQDHSGTISEPIIEEDPQPSDNDKNDQTLRCHICRKLYSQTHHFYGYLCRECGEFNSTKRNQKADLTGLTALVTGGRIKIGFEICLKLLRDGARVFVTTRFTKDALIRYQQQSDYDTWKDRLHIFGCDFLSQSQVSSLIDTIRQKVNKLDILINNAAQTLVRPKEFYHQELDRQKLPIQSSNLQPCLALQKFNNQMEQFPSVYANDLVLKGEEISVLERDEFDQPVDKRSQNSWTQQLHQVDLKDCFTTQVINSIVPFHLIGQLKPLMTGDTPSWVINVSSMEGVFYRSQKSQNHPHTNMAKASLNMITRTSAQEFKTSHIYMNSVDTGWVTNQNPYPIAEYQRQKHSFSCPLDCIDGAMRVLDPIYQGVTLNEFPWGQFLKNYRSSFW